MRSRQEAHCCLFCGVTLTEGNAQEGRLGTYEIQNVLLVLPAALLENSLELEVKGNWASL